MHELAITENIIEVVTRHARQAGATHVLKIHLVIGELASIVDAHEWPPTSGDWSCPRCQAAQAQVIAGREFSIDHIEVE